MTTIPKRERKALERLLGPAEAFGPDALRWTRARLRSAPQTPAVPAYDPSEHEAVYYHHDLESGLRETVSWYEAFLSGEPSETAVA